MVINNLKIKFYSAGKVPSPFFKRTKYRLDGATRRTASFGFYSSFEVLTRVKARLDHLFASYALPVEITIDEPSYESRYQADSDTINANHFRRPSVATQQITIICNQDPGNFPDFTEAVCNNSVTKRVALSSYRIAEANIVTFLTKCNAPLSAAEMESAIYSIVGQFFKFNPTTAGNAGKSTVLGGNLYNFDESNSRTTLTKSFEKNVGVNSDLFVHDASIRNRLLTKLVSYASESDNNAYSAPQPLRGAAVLGNYSSAREVISRARNWQQWQAKVVGEASGSITGLIQRDSDEDIYLFPVDNIRNFTMKDVLSKYKKFNGYFSAEIIHPSQLSVVENGSGNSYAKYRKNLDHQQQPLYVTNDETNVSGDWATKTKKKYNFIHINGSEINDPDLNHATCLAVRIKGLNYKTNTGEDNTQVYKKEDNIGAYAFSVDNVKLNASSVLVSTDGLYLQSKHTSGSSLKDSKLQATEMFVSMNGERYSYIAMFNRQLIPLDSYNEAPTNNSTEAEVIVACSNPADGKFGLYVTKIFDTSKFTNGGISSGSQENVFFSPRGKQIEAMVYKDV